MINVSLHGVDLSKLDFSKIDEKGYQVAKTIKDRSGEGNDFLVG